MAKTEVKSKHESMALFFTLKKIRIWSRNVQPRTHLNRKKPRLRSRESVKLSFMQIVAPTPCFNYDYAL